MAARPLLVSYPAGWVGAIGRLRGGAQLVARDGAQGLELAQENVPDLVLLDLNLPEIDGHEVLNRLQNDPRTLGLPVVAITADATRRQKDRLLRVGAIAYLTKPLNIKMFLEVLDRALEGARQVR
jgi:CheY-like chemotaxis protein